MKNKPKKQDSKKPDKEQSEERQEYLPDWSKTCMVCGSSPIVPITGMCGPCTFGEADTVGGNW